ncbi:MAG: pyrroloquinoline quinone-dependent dehydrogenase [Candidatus Hydrogenedentes bacterium]|nr:pyrroloquinoline quinone-dependent dehydrogenase [Candidatus Hydrogenedentota bacterium]
MKRQRLVLILLVVLILTGIWHYWPVRIDVALDGPTAVWPSYGNDPGGSRYSPLTQITRENVQHLEAAWTFHTGDVSNGKEGIPSMTAFEATPILIDTTLYFCSPFNRVFALDPETGQQKWVFDPKLDLKGKYANQLTSRGVSYWKDRQSGQERIFAATNDGRLIALDAATGIPCADFGAAGQIELKPDAGDELWLGEYQVTSPPGIAGDLVVVGSAISDSQRVDCPSGVVRAFDARTGALRWAWDLAPPDSVDKQRPKSRAGYVLGTPNVWAQMAYDPARDLLFVPTGNPSPDFYGGQRDGLDYYGSSVVALRGATGEVAWHFQTVHHDLWDYDVPAQPTITEIEHEGQRVPVVIQPTKMGHIFILHEETGEPIFGVEERPVPQSIVPGEQTSPTQPFPIKPPSLVPHAVSPDDAWGILWADRGDCREKLEKIHFEGIFTPPRVDEPTLMYPGCAGGSNWGGVAVDPERQILIANAINLAWVVTLISRDKYDEVKKNNPHTEVVPQDGTPYGMRRDVLASSLDLPCNPPPWGTYTAIDLKTGDFLWQKPLGTVRDLAPLPIPIKYGVPNIGGSVVTASGLAFIGATLDNYIRAFDIETGKELWKGRLPAGGQATPMTYRLRPDSKQFVVIAAGGHGHGGSTLGDAVVAYTLP